MNPAITYLETLKEESKKSNAFKDGAGVTIGGNGEAYAAATRYLANHYGTADDPSSEEARIQAAQFLSATLPHVTFEDAYRDYDSWIKEATGYELDSKGALNAISESFKSAGTSMLAGARYTSLFLEGFLSGELDSPQFEEKKNELKGELSKLKTGYRTDYQNFNPLTRAFINAGEIAPSVAMSVGTYGLGALLAPVIPVAPAIARAVNFAQSALFETGAALMELDQAEDELGNRMDDDTNLAFSLGIGVLSGLVEVKFDELAKSTVKPLKNLLSGITGETIEDSISRSTIRTVGKEIIKKQSLQFASDVAKKTGENILSESTQEAFQDLISMIGQNGAFKVANMRGAQFDDEFYTWEEMAASVFETIKKTASGTAVLGIVPSITNTAVEWYQSNGTDISKANKTSKASDTSKIVDISNIEAEKADGEKSDLSPIDRPVSVVQVGDKYVPVKDDAQSVAMMKRDGGKKAHVEIVNETGEITERSRHEAQELAQSLGADYTEGFVVFESKTKAKAQAEKFAMAQDDLVGFVENEDGFMATVRRDGVNENIGFSWKEAKPEARISRPRQKQEPIQDNGIYRSVTEDDDFDKRRFDAVFSHANKLKWKDDKSYIRDKFIAPAVNIFMGQGYDKNTALASARRTAIIIKNASNIIGMSAKQYYGENYSNKPIQLVTPEMEADIRKSDAWRNSVIEMRRQEGITDDTDLANDIATRTMKGFLKRENGIKTIYVTKDMDATTIAHEISHGLLDELSENEIGKNMIGNLYGAELELDGGEVGLNVQEAFARDFSQYQLTGRMKTKKMSDFFKRMVDAVRNIFSMFSNELRPEVVEEFDKLMKVGEANVKGDETPLVTSRDRYLDILADKLEDGDIDGIEEMLASSSMQVGDRPSFATIVTGTSGMLNHDLQWTDSNGDLINLNDEKNAMFRKWIAMPMKLADIGSWHSNIKDSPVDLSNGIYFSRSVVKHILGRHINEQENIDISEVQRIEDYIRNPIAVVQATGQTSDSILFVTDIMRSFKWKRTDGSFKNIRTPLVIAVKEIEAGNNQKKASVASMFPFKPWLQGNREIMDYMVQPGMLYAVDKKRIGKLTSSTDLWSAVDILTDSNKNIIDLSQEVKKEPKKRFIVKRKPVTDENASFQVSSALSVQDVTKAIEDTSTLVEKIADSRLERILDSDASEVFKEQVRKEVRFRNVYRNDTTLVSIARKGFKEYRSLVDEFDWNDAIEYMLDYMDEHGDREDWNMETETGDQRWFAKRMIRYLSDGSRNKESVIEDKIKVGESTRRQQRDVLASGNYGKVVKNLVSKGIANRNTIITLSDAMERVARRIGSDNPSISDLNDLIAQTLRERSAVDKKNAKEIDRLTRRVNVLETYRDLKDIGERMDRKRRELGRIAKVVESADSMMNNALQAFWRSMDKGTEIPERDFLMLGGMFDEYIEDFGGSYFAVPFTDIPLGQRMDSLRELMKSYKNMAKEQREAKIAEKKTETNELIKNAVSSMYDKELDTIEDANAVMDEALDGKTFGSNTDEKQYKKRWRYLTENLRTYSRTLRKMGPGIETLFLGSKDHYGMNDAAERENRGIIERSKRMTETIKDALNLDEKEYNRFLRFGRFKEFSPDFTEMTGRKYSISEAMGMYAYSKQEDAVRHMLSENGNRYTPEMLEYVNANLDEKYKNIVDAMIEDTSGKFEEVSRVFYRTNNKRLGQIMNYLPLVSGIDTSYMSDELELRMRHRRAAVNSSMTKERTFGIYPLEMDMFRIYDKAVAMQEHYIASAELAKQFDFILSSEGGNLLNLIKVKYGKERSDVIQKMVEDFKRPTSPVDDVSRLIGTMRNHYIISRLAFAPLSVLKQFPTALYALSNSSGPQDAVARLSTLARFLADPSYRKEATGFIYSKSSQMENRNASLELRSIREWNPDSQYSRMVKQLGDWGLAWIEHADRTVANAIWMATYESNVRNGMEEQEAVVNATQFILDTQPGGMNKDNSPLYNSRNEMVKWLLVFTNALNKQYNMFVDLKDNMKKHEFGRAAASAISLGLTIGLMTVVGGGAFDDDDDDKNSDDFLQNFLAELVATVPLIGPGLQGLIQGYGYGTSDVYPVMELPERIGSALKALQSGEDDRIIAQAKNLAVTVQDMVGLPGNITSKLYNVVDNDWNFLYLLNHSWGSWYDEARESRI